MKWTVLGALGKRDLPILPQEHGKIGSGEMRPKGGVPMHDPDLHITDA